MNQVAQRTRARAGVFAAFVLAWRRAFTPKTEEQALTMYSPMPRDLAAAQAEVEALTPTTEGQWEVDWPRTSRFRLAMYILIPALIAGTGAAIVGTHGEATRCTWGDGTSTEGVCMFDDEFTTFDTDVWHAANDWSGPLQNITPDVSCFREENVSVAAGILTLRMSINARASCPQTWSTTAYYTSNYEPSWTPGATSYDNAVVDMKSFRFKYGRVQMRITLPPGRGPGGDVSLWGVDCQRSGGVVGALSDLFTLASGRPCNWPELGSAEMDIIQSSRTGATTIINTSVYTASSPDSPTLIDAFHGINYYGARNAQPTTAGFTAWINGTVTNPTTSYHVYELLWLPPIGGGPDRWSISVDGIIAAIQTPTPVTWIPSGEMFMMLWNAATVTVTDGDLPSDMLVDYVRISCPPGVTCTWSGAGAL
jgi:beta-glucanase (GH16 family)